MMEKNVLVFVAMLVSLSAVPGYSFTAYPTADQLTLSSSVLRGSSNLNAVLRTKKETCSSAVEDENNNNNNNNNSRRDFLSTSAISVVGAVSSNFLILPGAAVAATGASDGNLPDLPPDAVRSYLQYRIPLQIAADSYMWEIQKQISRIDDWGDVNQLFQTNNNRGQGQPNKIERDYVNVMRILGLSFPPDEADAMRDAQFQFEKGMAKISKVTRGVRRDLPVEINPADIVLAQKGWDEGRVALNKFLSVINDSTGLKEMTLIPPAGPNQTKEYGRSQSRYTVLIKKTKLCQNRGGPALSQAWGQLMISGYMQDSCGIPDLEDYFFQSPQ